MPFRDIVGHRPIVALLARSIARDSLPPSLVFSGPAGVGKRATAVALAQAVNCLNPTRSQPPATNPQTPAGSPQPLEIDACGTCAACTHIARGIHPDVLAIEPGDSGSIKIEQIRDAIE